MTNTCNKCGLKNWHIGNVGKLPIHNGVCQICEDSKKIFKIQDQKNRKLLDDYFQNLRNEYKYDCIVLFTGDTLADMDNYDRRGWGRSSYGAGLNIGYDR